jgi:ABC-type transporter Mla MlaB component
MSNDEAEWRRERATRPDGTAPSGRRTGYDAVDLDVSWLVPADLSAVDALARLRLAASRCGRSLRLHGADGGLAELLELVGLSDILHLCPHCRSAKPLS